MKQFKNHIFGRPPDITRSSASTFGLLTQLGSGSPADGRYEYLEFRLPAHPDANYRKLHRARPSRAAALRFAAEHRQDDGSLSRSNGRACAALAINADDLHVRKLA